MAIAHHIYPSETPHALLSPDSELPAGSERASIPDEASPLLQPKHTPRRTISEWWNSARSSFFDDNLGLLLVAASQFFFSAMNMSVKWLNSSDEPVPTLEVCVKRPEWTIFPGADYFLAYAQLIQVRMVRSSMCR